LLKLTRIAVITGVLAFAGSAHAESVRVERFQGARAKFIRQAVVASLKTAGHDLGEGAASNLSISGNVKKRGKNFSLKLKLLSADGEVIQTTSYSARGAAALKNKILKSLTGRFGDEIGSVSGNAEEMVDEDLGNDEDENSSSDSGIEDSATPVNDEAKQGLFGLNASLTLSMKTMSRDFSYSGGLETMAPRYTLPLTYATSMRATYSWQKNWEANLDVTFPRNIESTVPNGTAFPTSSFALYGGARYMLGRLHAAAGYGTQSFQISDFEGTVKPDIPSVSYHYLRAGAGYWHPIKVKYALGASIGYRLVLAAGEIRDSQFYSGSSTSGLDMEIFATYNLSKNTYVRAALEAERYSHTIGDANATDLYYSVGAAAGVRL